MGFFKPATPDAATDETSETDEELVDDEVRDEGGEAPAPVEEPPPAES